VATARVYVDGFSLYYGACRGTGNLWLDICQMADLVLRNDEVVEVRYYTSLDPVPERGERQKQLWGALDEHDDRLTRIEVDPYDPVQQLGLDLVANAAAVGLREVALVVSDDARLAPFVTECWETHRHSCGIASPSGRFHPDLVAGAGFRKHIRKSKLITLPDTVGGFTKPKEWEGAKP
jgi:hypothetical protein